MRKILCLFLLVIMCCCNGCKCNKEEIGLKQIPDKENELDRSALSSPINSHNLDDYMFRDDVQYVDLRSTEMVLEEGYVAGFEFIPFYSLIASFKSERTLYRMESTYDENGNRIPAGQVGGFVAQYRESDSIIKSLISNDKYIFLISQGGSESSYMINLLIQLGYNPSLLYNVGGVSNSEGVASYKSIETNKYFVAGSGELGVTINYSIVDTLTPIE